MPLLICYSCNRQRTIEKATGKAFNCSNCGAHDIRPIRKTNRVMLSLSLDDRDGEESHAARGQTYAGLAWIAQQKGYKPGWVGWRFKKIYGSWPNGESGLPASAPSAHLLKWLAKDNAKYRKLKREEEAKAEIVLEKKSEAASMLMTPEDYEAKW